MCAGFRVYCAFDVGLVLICGYLVVGLVMDVFRLMFGVGLIVFLRVG